MHTETAFHPYKPDYVMLFCLRGDPNAVTTYANLSDVLKILDPDTRKVLKKKIFTTSVDISFRSNGEEDQQIPISIVGEKDGKLTFTYDSYFVRGINEEANNALVSLRSAIKQCTIDIVLQSGDLLVIDNNSTIHGRREFQPRYDGTDRWIQRVLVIREMPPMEERKGNVITTKVFN
jgi:alpha-ketoglutarate-dependent taurine dioxygenase